MSTPNIIPHLWFDREAKEAAAFYVSVFPNSRITGSMVIKDTPSGDAEQVEFELNGSPFIAISAGPFFKFTEAISFVVQCNNQEEIDYYWEKLSAVPEAEQCGWIKDKYGLSWQIVPRQLDEMMKSGTDINRQNLTKAFLGMKKFDLEKLRDAFNL